MHTVEDRARRYASKAHAETGQRRKYTDEPYIVHPAAVVELVRSVSHTEEMLAAAWLHDTVEDTASTLNDIRSHFGDTIASLVDMLTNRGDTAGQKRVARKVADFQHSQRASPEAQTIKLADIIDNTRSIIHFDPQFARVYLIEKRVQIALLTTGNPALWQQAERIVEQGIRQLAQPPHNIPASWFVQQEAKYRQPPQPESGQPVEK